MPFASGGGRILFHDECIQLAKDYGADSKPGAQVATQTTKGATVGGATGTAVGTVTGNLDRGAAAAATREILRSGDPDPVFKQFVEKCLRDKARQLLFFLTPILRYFMLLRTSQLLQIADIQVER